MRVCVRVCVRVIVYTLADIFMQHLSNVLLVSFSEQRLSGGWRASRKTLWAGFEAVRCYYFCYRGRFLMFSKDYRE